MKTKIILPDNHKRSLAITTRHIDKSIKEIESLFNNENTNSSVSEIVKNLPPEKRDAISELLKELKIRNEKLIQDFSLPAERMYEDRIVRGKISMMWVLLSDSTSKGLKGYGELPVEESKILDDHIESLLEIIDRLQSI